MAVCHRVCCARRSPVSRSAGAPLGDIHLEENTLSVSRSLLPDGTPEDPKSRAGRRTVAVVPSPPAAGRRLAVLRSGHSGPEEYVISTTDGKPVSERNLRRVLTAAKTAAGLDGVDGRFSWHSLRHSAGSVRPTEYGLPVTTVSKMLGHATPSFTLACYGRDPRDQQTVVADVLARAEAAGLGR